MHLCLLLVALFSFHTHSVATEGMQAWEIALIVIGVVGVVVVVVGVVGAGIAIRVSYGNMAACSVLHVLYWLMHAVAYMYIQN